MPSLSVCKPIFYGSRRIFPFLGFAITNIIKLFNKSGGLVFGIFKGFVIVYAILAILSVLSPIISQLGIISSIQDSILGSSMYNNNVLLKLFFK